MPKTFYVPVGVKVCTEVQAPDSPLLEVNQPTSERCRAMLDNNFAFAVVRSKYPHVGSLIEEHWEEPDFGAVMDELLNPDPRRQGFPSAVFNALRSLALMHEMEVIHAARQGEHPQLILNLEH